MCYLLLKTLRERQVRSGCGRGGKRTAKLLIALVTHSLLHVCL